MYDKAAPDIHRLPQHSFVLSYEQGQVILPAGTFYLGRDRACFIRLVDSAVSRQHLLLEVGDALHITDLGSRNGTLLNGRYLRGRIALRHADELTLGGHSFKVQVVELEDDELEDEITDNYVVGGPEPHAFASRTPTAPAHVAVKDAPIPKNAAISSDRPTGPAPQVEAQPTRRAPRNRVQLTAAYEGVRVDTEGLVTNLNRFGLFLVTDKLDPAGSPCRVRVDLDREGWAVHVRGTVRHTIHRGRRGMAIEFDRENDEIAKWLAR